MPTTERENEFFLTSVSLLEDDDELGGDTRVGGLFLKQSGDIWRVHHSEDMGSDQLMIYADSIYPRGFGSAQNLSRYLLWLDDADPERVTFSNEAATNFDPAEF